MVEHAETQIPTTPTSSIHDGVHPTFDDFISPLCTILILVVGFRMPAGAVVHSK